MRPTALAMSFALVAGFAADAAAQCCGTPTVAYSPVVAAPTPVVAQTTTVSNGWYPGKYLTDFTRNVFGLDRTTTTYTANYTPYTAGYTPYTAGYAPYAVGYAPSTYTAGYAQTAYRPTYPATWGQVQTVSRPVVLSPVVSAPAYDSCNACSACGVEQASYASPTCSSCNAGSSYAAPQSSYNDYPEPRPALGPEDNPAPERSIRSQRPEVDSYDELDTFEDDRTPSDPAAANEYWRAPPLFAPPSNRVTKSSHPAPVQTAVYRRQPETRQTAFRPSTAAPAKAKPATGKVHHLSADGWSN